MSAPSRRAKRISSAVKPWMEARISIAIPQVSAPPTGRSFASSQFACARAATPQRPVTTEESSSTLASASRKTAFLKARSSW